MLGARAHLMLHLMLVRPRAAAAVGGGGGAWGCIWTGGAKTPTLDEVELLVQLEKLEGRPRAPALLLGLTAPERGGNVQREEQKRGKTLRKRSLVDRVQVTATRGYTGGAFTGSICPACPWRSDPLLLWRRDLKFEGLNSNKQASLRRPPTCDRGLVDCRLPNGRQQVIGCHSYGGGC